MPHWEARDGAETMGEAPPEQDHNIRF